VELAAATDDLPRAAEAAEELQRVADQYGTHVLRAAAATAGGHVALARGELEPAIEALRRASRTWLEIDAPYEAARARTLLAEAYLGTGDADAAELELAAAAAAFDRLGAGPDAARVASLLHRAQAGARAGEPTPRVGRTFMFTDIVRSTNLIDAIGDEAWARLLAWHDDTIRALLREHGGEEVDHAGDGFFVAFASADAALACSLAIRGRLQEHRRSHGFAPSIRIGMHTAEALATSARYEGRSVHIAARIGAMAEADEVLVSRSVIDAAQAPPAHRAFRTERLRGIKGPVEVAALS
jgi:class 3 adenylate cyclase